nr:antitoxin [Leminorella richardii]
MTIKPSPTESEFETQEQANSYDRWFRAKVEAAMNSAKPRIPHEQVIAEIQVRLDAKRKVHNVG